MKKDVKQNRINVTGVFTILIVLSPFLMQYASGIPGVTLADLLMGIVSIVLVIKYRLKFITKKTMPLLLFWGFGFFVSLISFLIKQDITFEVITRFIRFSYYIYLVLVGAKYFDIRKGLTLYRKICIATSLYILTQVIAYKFAGIVLPFKILSIPWASGKTFGVEDVSSIANMYFYRPSGFFIEPGYAAQFLLPGLAFSLFGWMKSSKQIDWRSTVVIYVSLLISTSSQGLFLGTFIIAMFIVIRLFKSKDFSDITKNTILIFLGLGISIFFLRLDVVQLSLNKISGAISGGVRGGSSTALRLFRGFFVYLQIPIQFKIFGLGHGNLGNYVMTNNIITRFDPPIMSAAVADYANGVSTTLLYYGLFGFVLLGNIYRKFLKNTTDAFKLIALTQIVLSLVEGALFGVSIVFYFTFIFSGYNYGPKSLEKT